MPILTQCIHALSTSCTGHLLKHERQARRLGHVTEILSPAQHHGATTASLPVVIDSVFLHSENFWVVGLRLISCGPPILIARPRFASSDDPVKAVEVDLLRDVLQQWLRANPAHSAWNLAEHIHLVERLVAASGDAEPDIGITLSPIIRQPGLDERRPLGEDEPNQTGRFPYDAPCFITPRFGLDMEEIREGAGEDSLGVVADGAIRFPFVGRGPSLGAIDFTPWLPALFDKHTVDVTVRALRGNLVTAYPEVLCVVCPAYACVFHAISLCVPMRLPTPTKLLRDIGHAPLPCTNTTSLCRAGIG